MAITWDYEEFATTPYYHIYVVGGPLDNDDHDISIVLRIPRTPENDQGCQAIVDALTTIEARVEGLIWPLRDTAW